LRKNNNFAEMVMPRFHNVEKNEILPERFNNEANF